ncbi:MAG: ABC transporter permease [Gemmatimonadota bacterium]
MMLLPPILRRAARRLLRMLRWSRADRDLRDEVAHHLEEAAARHLAAGLSPAAARRAAALDFGGRDRWLEETRTARGVIWLQHLFADGRYAVRQMRSTPVLTVVAALSLAAGIGVVVAVVALINGAFFKPLPVPAPEELHRVYTSRDVFQGRGGEPYGWSSYPDFEDIRDSGIFTAAAAGFHVSAAVVGPSFGPARRTVHWVTPDYFDVLRLRLAAGRPLAPGGYEPEIVISHRVWRRDFQADPEAVGRVIEVNGVPLSVVGVAPPEFLGTVLDGEIFGWAPLLLQPRTAIYGVPFDDRGSRRLEILARLPAESSLATARARLDALAGRLASAHPEAWRRRDDSPHLLTIVPEAAVRAGGRPGGLAMASALMSIGLLLAGVLLVACTNVAGLLLARALTRRHEVAVRLTLGASRARLTAQLLMESLLLAALGGASGWLLGHWLTRLIEARFVMGAFDPAPDGRVLAITMVAALGCTVVFGLAPLRLALGADIRSALQRTAAAGRTRSFGRGAVIAVQVAAATLLLVASFTAAGGMRNHQRMDPGFQMSGLLVAQLDRTAFRSDTVRSPAYSAGVVELAAALPGVVSVGSALHMPMGDFRAGLDEMLQPDSALNLAFNVVTPGFFQTLELRVASGRLPRPVEVRDSPVAVVSRAYARAVGGNPVGGMLRGGSRLGRLPVVAVVDDARTHLTEAPAEPFVYVVRGAGAPAATRTFQAHDNVFLRVRPGAEASVARALVRGLRQRFPEALPPRVRPFSAVVGEITAYQEAGARAAVAIGAVQLALAAVGLYGMLLFMAVARTRELGIRLALGARPRQAGWAVAREGVAWSVRGTLAGALLAVPALLVGRYFLIGGGAFDPINFIAAVLTLVVAAVAAAWAPVRRAAGIAPAAALRHE